MKVKIPVEAANDIAQDLLNLVNNNGAPVDVTIANKTIMFKLNKKKDKLLVKIKGANDKDDEPDRSDDSEFMKDFKEIVRNGIKEVNPDIADEIADNLHYYLERTYGERLKDKEARKNQEDQEVSNQDVCQEDKRKVDIEEALETFFRPLKINPIAYLIQYTKANKDQDNYPIYHAFKKLVKKLDLDELTTKRLKGFVDGYRDFTVQRLYRTYIVEMAQSIGCIYPTPNENGDVDIEAIYDLYNLLLAISKRNENIAKMNQDMIDHVNDACISTLYKTFNVLIE